MSNNTNTMIPAQALTDLIDHAEDVKLHHSKIKRLVNLGLIEERPAKFGGRFMAITDKGRAVLAAIADDAEADAEADADAEAEAEDIKVTDTAIATKPVRESSRRSKAMVACACKCGGFANGGRYLPGHDARHASNLATAIVAGEITEAEALSQVATHAMERKVRGIVASRMIRIEKRAVKAAK